MSHESHVDLNYSVNISCNLEASYRENAQKNGSDKV